MEDSREDESKLDLEDECRLDLDSYLFVEGCYC